MPNSVNISLVTNDLVATLYKRWQYGEQMIVK